MARRMEDDDRSEDYGLPDGTPWICSPLMQTRTGSGAAFQSQPAFEGDVPDDNTGLIPNYEFQRKKEK